MMLFVAVTFYKGLTGNPCLLNISFLAALIMSIVFLISGFVLLFGVSEFCLLPQPASIPLRQPLVQRPAQDCFSLSA